MTGSPGRLRGLPAAFSLGAAAIHFAAAPDHFAEFAPFGIAFAALGWFQVVWAVAWLQWPGRSARVLAIAINAAAVGAWLVSRSVGLPFGPEAGLPEPIALPDVLATGLEAMLVPLLVLGRRQRPDPGPVRFTLTFGTAFVAVAILASVGVATIASGHAEHHHDVGAVIEPEPTPIPTLKPTPTPAAPPAAGSSTPPATTSSRPPAPTPEASGLAVLAMVPILFGTRLGSGGELYETGSAFPLGQVVVWKAELGYPVGADTLHFQVVQRLADGREFVHWDEAFVPPDPTATAIVAASDLALFAHDGAGTYLIRYVRGLAIIAEGSVTLTPAA